MKAVVTGAAGFLGSFLSEALVARGWNVLGVDNFCTGSADKLAALRDNPRFRFLEQDICLPFDTGACDLILNFASPASPREYSRLGIETLRVGSAGVEVMLENASRHGATFLQASTSECYGDPEVHPQPESYWGHVNPVGPRSVYDESKRYAEALTMAYHRYRGVETRLVRIFNTYGPRMAADDGRVIPNFMLQALRGQDLTVYGDGAQTRSFCYVDDEVDGILKLAESAEVMPVNIGNPTEMTMLECAQVVLQVTGSRSGIRFEELPVDDPKQRRPDITRAKQLLGWQPGISLREGLEQSLAWFRSQV